MQEFSQYTVLLYEDHRPWLLNQRVQRNHALQVRTAVIFEPIQQAAEK
jgi:hypothetical protein